jgi:tetratricopeptide (TPR) repeat protein
VPLFIDVWAPWCHTCRFLRSYVLSDEALRKQAGRFVWLAMNTEQPSGAAFVEKFPIDSWPTLLIVDPTSERAALKWLGSVTVTQLAQLLDEGERALRSSNSDPLEQALADADRLLGAGKSAEAARAFGALLSRAGPAWPDRVRIEESRVLALEDAGLWQECADAAREAAPGLPPGHSRSDVIGTGLVCAVMAEDPSPWRTAALASLEPLARDELGDDLQLADDRSGLYEFLVMARQKQGDEAGAKKLAREWLTYLERVAGAAPSSEARSAFDAHRLEAALDLGDAALAVPALLQSERDSPTDFEAPARLAVAYCELGRYAEALAKSQRAFDLALGPRRLRMLSDRAAIYQKQGDRAAQLKTLQQALDLAATLPAAQRPASEVGKLRQALAAAQGR